LHHAALPLELTMASLTCSFCNHANPAGAQFCNECGSRLGLRPCARCDAINDVDAKYCHHCGTVLNERPATSVGAPGQPPRGADAAAESSVVKALGGVVPEPAGARAASPASVRELSSAAARLDAFWRDSLQAVEAARAMKPDVADAPADRPVAVLPLSERGESPIDVGARYGGDRRGGARAAVAFVVLAVGAVAAYYAYEQWTARNSAPAVSAPIVASPPGQTTAPGAQQAASTASQAPFAMLLFAQRFTPPAIRAAALRLLRPCRARRRHWSRRPWCRLRPPS
jgi:ribosomal protein L40E